MSLSTVSLQQCGCFALLCARRNFLNLSRAFCYVGLREPRVKLAFVGSACKIQVYRDSESCNTRARLFCEEVALASSKQRWTFPELLAAMTIGAAENSEIL